MIEMISCNFNSLIDIFFSSGLELTDYFFSCWVNWSDDTAFLGVNPFSVDEQFCLVRLASVGESSEVTFESLS